MMLIGELWKTGKLNVDAARAKENFGTPEYFRRLEEVVQGIRDYLKQHQLTGKHEALVKHGDAAATVLVDLDNLVLIPDPKDPETPFFHIPSTKISKE
jgi:hypothetical protein